MRKLVLLFMVVASLGVTGGATRPFDDYTPLNKTYYSNHNNINVGEFTYSAMQTKGMRSDQIENTALGSIYIGTSIAGLVRTGTIEELKNAGVVIRDGEDVVLSGDVTTFKAADLGFTIDWTIGVTYTISRKATNETLFSRHYEPPMMNTRKLFMSQATVVGFMHKMIAAACDMFISDPDARNILDEPGTN